MTAVSGNAFCFIGTPATFPRRNLRREIERQGGEVLDRVKRRTSCVVFGRSLIDTWDETSIESRFDAEKKAGRRLLSENGLLRMLELRRIPVSSTLSRELLLERAGLPPCAFDMLALFDAFEQDAEPFTFRDLILAKKYAMLLVGATWSTIARSIQRSASVSALTSLSLHAEGNEAIYARLPEGFSELDGQVLLPLNRPDDKELKELFALAEEAETQDRYAEAAAIYRDYLSYDPNNAVAYFNRGNCLRSAGEIGEAVHAYMGALKRAPKFIDAWFNLADLEVAQGKVGSARRHLQRAIALDKTYADAVFNLASLEYDAGNLAEARKWWSRYLELDDRSEWARTAARGIQYIDLNKTQKTAS